MTKKELTTIITVKEKHNFHKCFESLSKLNSDFIVLDCIGIESINNFCNNNQIKYIKFLDQPFSFSKAKNNVINFSKTKWLFFIDSNESLINGHNQLNDIINSSQTNAYYISIINEYTVTKEIRLILNNNKHTFQNAYFESIVDHGKVIDVFLSSKNALDHKKVLQHFLETEMSNPSQNSIKYYSACCYLSCNMIKEFITKAEEFIFLSKKNEMPQIMTNYYLAVVKCIKKINLQDAIKHISVCILYKPDMAEFWCCLADIFYQNNDIEKAKVFYKIAIIAGSKRRKFDTWPLEIKKYKEYPSNMIKSCLSIQEKRKQYKKI